MRNLWLWIVIVVIVAGGGYWWWQNQQAPALAPVDTGASTQIPTPTDTSGVITETSAPMSATVTYDGSSFSPSEVTIKKGGTVTFTNTGGSMWVASGPHPEHTNYDGTARGAHCATGSVPSFDQCRTGSSYTFTFDKVGTWPYHNHLNATVFGKVIVVE